MPACTRICDPSDPFAQLSTGDPQQAREDLSELFSDTDLIFRTMDFDTFDLDDVDINALFDYDSDCEKSKFRESRNHDCMWGGQCCNREYQRTQPPPVVVQKPPPPPPPPVYTPPPPVLYTHSSQNKVVTIQKCVQGTGKCDERTENVLVVTKNVRTPVIKTEPGRSLLLNRTNVHNNPSPVKTPLQIKREYPTPQNSRPETPQSISDSDSSDEDLSPIPIDSQNTSIFRSALDALSTSSSSSSDWQDELMLFGDGRGRRTNPSATPTDLLRLSASAKSDHNYDGSSKNFSIEGLGVDTPSDSEEDEEIDVVSLSERSSSSRSSSCSSGLPTRPTQRDQRHLEEITTSLLSASEAVSRKIRQTYVQSQQTKFKRKKYQSESSEDDDDYEDEYEEDEEVYHQKYHRQNKRQKPSSSQTVRRKKSTGGRFSGVEEDSQEKRDLHNNMERMRRIDLRNSFEELKALVPTVSNKDRAAKVVILKEAAGYCQELQAESQSKCMQVMALRKEQERLRGMVSSLRKAAAMACVKMPKRVI